MDMSAIVQVSFVSPQKRQRVAKKGGLTMSVAAMEALSGSSLAFLLVFARVLAELLRARYLS